MSIYSFHDLMKCAAREAALRRAVYKKRGMTPEREREIALMEAIAAHFAEIIRMSGFISSGKWPD
jgi:hypothetical protein